MTPAWQAGTVPPWQQRLFLKDSWHPEMSHHNIWAQVVSTMKQSAALRVLTSSLLHQLHMKTLLIYTPAILTCNECLSPLLLCLWLFPPLYFWRKEYWRSVSILRSTRVWQERSRLINQWRRDCRYMYPCVCMHVSGQVKSLHQHHFTSENVVL